MSSRKDTVHRPKPCLFRQSHCDPSSLSNKYKYFCKLWFRTTDKADVWSFIGMFMLSLLQKGSQEVVLQGHPSSTAQGSHWQRQLCLHHLCPPALLYVVRNVPIFNPNLFIVYSLILSSTSISQLLQCPVLREFILSVNLQEMILSGFLSFPAFSVLLKSQHHVSACRIICLYFSWAFWPEQQGDWPCHSTGDDTAQPKWSEVGTCTTSETWSPTITGYAKSTQNLSCNLSKPTQERGALAMQSVHIFSLQGFVSVEFCWQWLWGKGMGAVSAAVQPGERHRHHLPGEWKCDFSSHEVLITLWGCRTCRVQGLMHITQKALLSSDSPQPKLWVHKHS